MLHLKRIILGNQKPPTDTEEAPFFFRLPLELRELIYGLAYRHEEEDTPLKLVTIEAWRQRQRFRKYDEKRNFVFSPPPPCPLNGMLVNHQFYNEATDHWFRTNVFALPCAVPTTEFPASIFKRLTRLRVPWSFEHDNYGELQCLAPCPRLTTLTLTVTGDVFDEMSDTKICYLHAFDDDDFRAMPSIKVLREMLSLKTVTLVPDRCWNAEGEEEIQQFRDNVATLQAFIAVQLAERRPTIPQPSVLKRLDAALERVEAFGRTKVAMRVMYAVFLLNSVVTVVNIISHGRRLFGYLDSSTGA